MSKSHNYKNPSKTQDLGHVEAQVTKGKKYYDKDGWEISPPISDSCLLYTSPSPRDRTRSRMPSSA